MPPRTRMVAEVRRTWAAVGPIKQRDRSDGPGSCWLAAVLPCPPLRCCRPPPDDARGALDGVGVVAKALGQSLGRSPRLSFREDLADPRRAIPLPLGPPLGASLRAAFQAAPDTSGPVGDNGRHKRTHKVDGNRQRPAPAVGSFTSAVFGGRFARSGTAADELVLCPRCTCLALRGGMMARCPALSRLSFRPPGCGTANSPPCRHQEI